LKRMILKFWTDDSGATAIEYGLIAAGIALAIITVVNGLGTTMNDKFTSISSSLKSFPPPISERGHFLHTIAFEPRPLGESPLAGELVWDWLSQEYRRVIRSFSGHCPRSCPGTRPQVFHRLVPGLAGRARTGNQPPFHSFANSPSTAHPQGYPRLPNSDR
jgi:pilus assembly protein Flp/PilA